MEKEMKEIKTADISIDLESTASKLKEIKNEELSLQIEQGKFKPLS